MNKNNSVIGHRVHFFWLFLLLTIVLSSLVVAEGATRGTVGTNVCDTTLYSVPGQSGDPWVYGCVDAAHGKACKKATGEIKPSFTIPNPTTDATYQRLLQTCSGTGATTASTSDPSNKCDRAQFPINNIAGDQYAYGCVDTANAKSCKKLEGGIFKASFSIQDALRVHPNDQAYQRLLQSCSGTSAGTVSTSDSSNKCDAIQFPLNNIAGDPYAYGCVDTANAKSCKKSEGGIFKASFSIQDALRVDPNDQAYQRLAQLCVPGAASASGATASSGPASCTNPQQCKEIDEVWQRIGSLVRKSSDVWDTRSMPFWKAFSILYPSLTGTSVVTASGPDAFDSIIREAAATTGTPPKVEFALIKAIMVAESEFKPNDISSTGCSGLLQICATSAKEEIQVQCPQVRSVGPRKCDPGTCEINVFDSAPTVPWCKVCTSGINCVDDDRFDPRKNIFSSTKTIQRKMNAVPAGLCGMECQIAAYNIGEKVILAAIDAARVEIGSGPLDWNTVYGHITTQLMKDNGYEDSNTWNEVERENKRVNLKGYVAKIMRSYQSYKAGTS